MADAGKRSGIELSSTWSRGILGLNNMAPIGGSVDSMISSDTMSSVSLCENNIPGSSLDGKNL